MNKDYKSYDYLEVITKKETEKLYIKIYRQLGWELYETKIGISSKNIKFNTKLIFKRSKNIKSKLELNIIEQNISKSFDIIRQYEKRKYLFASLYSYLFSLLGVILLLIFLFNIVGYINISFDLSAILGIIGIGLLIPPYFIYVDTLVNQEQLLAPKIKYEYNKINEYCKQAQKLIFNSE